MLSSDRINATVNFLGVVNYSTALVEANSPDIKLFESRKVVLLKFKGICSTMQNDTLDGNILLLAE